MNCSIYQCSLMKYTIIMHSTPYNIFSFEDPIYFKLSGGRAFIHIFILQGTQYVLKVVFPYLIVS